MLKDLKMAGKMILGFGAVLIIIAVIIAMTVLDMFKIQGLAEDMDYDFLPEIELATNLERDSLQTMYNMRGYALNFGRNYRVVAKEYLAEINTIIDDAKGLAEGSENLVKLEGAIVTIEKEIANYSKGADQTEILINQILTERDILDRSAAEFKKETSSFLTARRPNLRRILKRGNLILP